MQSSTPVQLFKSSFVGGEGGYYTTAALKPSLVLSLSVNSRLCVLGGNHKSEGGEFDDFFIFWCILGDFLRDLGF